MATQKTLERLKLKNNPSPNTKKLCKNNKSKALYTQLALPKLHRRAVPVERTYRQHPAAIGPAHVRDGRAVQPAHPRERLELARPFRRVQHHFLRRRNRQNHPNPAVFARIWPNYCAVFGRIWCILATGIGPVKGGTPAHAGGEGCEAAKKDEGAHEVGAAEERHAVGAGEARGRRCKKAAVGRPLSAAQEALARLSGEEALAAEPLGRAELLEAHFGRRTVGGVGLFGGGRAHKVAQDAVVAQRREAVAERVEGQALDELGRELEFLDGQGFCFGVFNIFK